MTSNPIKPNQAVDLAEAVYLLSGTPSVEDAVNAVRLRYRNIFEVVGNSSLAGKTGGPGFLKCRTAFGLCLIGRKQFEGHAFIVFRGTDYLADWLTNLNASLSRSSNNQPIHAGFSETFKSLRPQLVALMHHVSGSQIHCIGHSLGGAVASLCAEWMELAYHVKPCLYTFGSPRIGLHGFASVHTRTLGPSNFYRVHRSSDVVPYIPIWPFIHAPLQAQTYRLPKIGTLPTKADHNIGLYADSIGDKSWQALKAPHNGVGSDIAVERWLLDKTFIGLTVDSLEWLGRAMVYVLERCMTGAARILSMAGSTQLTILDSIAVMLEKGVSLTETVSRWVLYLVRKILVLLGRPDIVEGADITRAFLRQVLLDLQQRVNTMVRRVLDQTLVKGQSV
ncbi:lipase family protein [Marinimicrobium locisalis]|uniref:lipase family protein n=1 Tax=Marinimicrobium locisalis TaxID=546022 RepID=UPI0032221F45